MTLTRYTTGSELTLRNVKYALLKVESGLVEGVKTKDMCAWLGRFESANDALTMGADKGEKHFWPDLEQSEKVSTVCHRVKRFAAQTSFHFIRFDRDNRRQNCFSTLSQILFD